MLDLDSRLVLEAFACETPIKGNHLIPDFWQFYLDRRELADGVWVPLARAVFCSRLKNGLHLQLVERRVAGVALAWIAASQLFPELVRPVHVTVGQLPLGARLRSCLVTSGLGCFPLAGDVTTTASAVAVASAGVALILRQAWAEATQREVAVVAVRAAAQAWAGCRRCAAVLVEGRQIVQGFGVVVISTEHLSFLSRHFPFSLNSFSWGENKGSQPTCSLHNGFESSV